MVPRPKGPPVDRRGDILDAALQVFAERGYAAATNAAIARKAGVTAAALYYYFPSKEELFRAAFAERQAEMMPAVDGVGAQLREEPPAVVIPLIIRSMLRFLSDERTRALVRIVMAEGPRNPEVAAVWQERVIERVMPTFVGYLLHQMEIGNLRRVDPRVMILAISGPIVTTVFVRDLLKAPITQDLANDDLAEQWAEAFLKGYAAR